MLYVFFSGFWIYLSEMLGSIKFYRCRQKQRGTEGDNVNSFAAFQESQHDSRNQFQLEERGNNFIVVDTIAIVLHNPCLLSKSNNNQSRCFSVTESWIRTQKKRWKRDADYNRHAIKMINVKWRNEVHISNVVLWTSIHNNKLSVHDSHWLWTYLCAHDEISINKHWDGKVQKRGR